MKDSAILRAAAFIRLSGSGLQPVMTMVIIKAIKIFIGKAIRKIHPGA
jgi:hypothetical protein